MDFPTPDEDYTLDLKKKKKKKKKIVEEVEEVVVEQPEDYTYSTLLERVFRTLQESNRTVGTKRYTMVPPQVGPEGSKKTAFVNIEDISLRMNRELSHIAMFLYAELGTSGSVDASKRLIIKGRFKQQQIENVLRRYILEYVTCKTCKSPQTILEKEDRLCFLKCKACGSRPSVAAIKSGFQAVTKGARKAAKAKAM